MKLTSDKAYQLLMDAQKNAPGGYIEHSLKVGEAAARIAEELRLDSDKARALGYIHDIGKMYGRPFANHAGKGYDYLLELGYDEEYANICLTHSYLKNDITCTAAGFVDENSYKYEFRKEFLKKHKYTSYDEIINLCDLICGKDFMLLEERLIDIIIRRGSASNTQYHISEAMKLKKDMDKKLEKDVYSLFPEIGKRIKCINK